MSPAAAAAAAATASMAVMAHSCSTPAAAAAAVSRPDVVLGSSAFATPTFPSSMNAAAVDNTPHLVLRQPPHSMACGRPPNVLRRVTGIGWPAGASGLHKIAMVAGGWLLVMGLGMLLFIPPGGAGQRPADKIHAHDGHLRFDSDGDIVPFDRWVTNFTVRVKTDDRLPGVVDVTDYGAVADGETNNVAAIARAAAKCVQLGSCTLKFPARSGTTVYRSSSIAIPSHTTLLVPRGVVLRGTETDADNIDVWPTQKTVEWPSRPCMSCPYACGGGCGPAKRAWLFIHNVTNVTITGGGTLHGGGHWWWCARADNERKGVPAQCASKVRLREMCPPRMIHVLDSTNIRISDLQIMWSPFWTTHVQFSRDVEIFNVSVYNPNNRSFSSANGDGFDIASSTNVHVHDSVIDVSDDASAVRAGSGWAGQQSEIAPNAFGGRCSTENITFARIEVRNGHGLGRCGEDARGGIRNVTWKDIIVNGDGPTQRGSRPPNAIRFEASPTDGGLYDRITFERITGSHVGFGFSMLENHLTYKPNSSGGPYPKIVPGGPFPTPAPQRPALRNIVVRDVDLREADTVGTFFTLVDAPVESFMLSNITIEPKAGTKKPGWKCAAWGKGDGKEKHGRVHACGTADAITPPLTQPSGCAFTCADSDGEGTTASSRVHGTGHRKTMVTTHERPTASHRRSVARWDLASVAMAHGWSAHATVGEASFDDFTHAASNPVFTGSGDEQWPVNGFLYGGAAKERNVNQTIYIGLYGRNYAKPWSMLGASSTDGGRSFQLSKGPLVCDSRTLLFNLTHGCPDGSAVDDGHGGVHMVFGEQGSAFPLCFHYRPSPLETMPFIVTLPKTVPFVVACLSIRLDGRARSWLYG